MKEENADVYIFVNQLYYGKVKWPTKGESCPKPIKLRIRLIHAKTGDPGFLGSCCPEYVSGYGSTSVTEGRMYIMALGIKGEYTLIDSIVTNGRTGELEITIRDEK
jgi:hypothetical protein